MMPCVMFICWTGIATGPTSLFALCKGRSSSCSKCGLCFLCPIICRPGFGNSPAASVACRHIMWVAVTSHQPALIQATLQHCVSSCMQLQGNQQPSHPSMCQNDFRSRPHIDQCTATVPCSMHDMAPPAVFWLVPMLKGVAGSP